MISRMRGAIARSPATRCYLGRFSFLLEAFAYAMNVNMCRFIHR